MKFVEPITQALSKNCNRAFLHGSAANRVVSSKFSSAFNDIDLVVVVDKFSKFHLREVYEQLSKVRVAGQFVRIEKRVGPVSHSDGEGLNLHVAIYTEAQFRALSPAIHAIYYFGHQTLIGDELDGLIEGIEHELAVQYFQSDLSQMVSEFTSSKSQFWQWSSDDPPRKLMDFTVLKGPRIIRKRVRYWSAILRAWTFCFMNSKHNLPENIDVTFLISHAEKLERTGDLEDPFKAALLIIESIQCQLFGDEKTGD